MCLYVLAVPADMFQKLKTNVDPCLSYSVQFYPILICPMLSYPVFSLENELSDYSILVFIVHS